jgi:adenylosuccinate lyase
VKLHGKENDLIERIKASNYFAPIHDKLGSILDPISFIGRAPEQVTAVMNFIFNFINRLRSF